MFGSFQRQNTSRQSSLPSKRAQLFELVSHWLSPSSAKPDVPDLSIFKSSLDLQRKSKDFVFYDRGCGQVQEFPYPLTSKGYRVAPSGFKQYFKARRLGFECFCGLMQDVPQLLEVKVGKFGHYMSCNTCGIYVNINAVRETANVLAIYPFMDPNIAVQPTTLSTTELINQRHPHAMRRSHRTISDKAYNAHRGRHTADFGQEKSNSTAVKEFFEELKQYSQKAQESKGEKTGTHRALSSSPIPAEELLRDFSRSLNLKSEGGDMEACASSSNVSQIKFCRFCDIGMAEEYLEQHEFDCWTEQLTAVSRSDS